MVYQFVGTRISTGREVWGLIEAENASDAMMQLRAGGIEIGQQARITPHGARKRSGGAGIAIVFIALVSLIAAKLVEVIAA